MNKFKLMNPGLLEQQLRENATNLDDFYKDLKIWGQEMKRKEESLKKSKDDDNKLSGSSNKKTRISPAPKKEPPKENTAKSKAAGKTKVTDYSAWEKFDADAECEKVDYDENEESDLTDESDETLREKADAEKEKGNKFFKQNKLDEAIECYTKAIDCYSFDPIFYANRALCFLKKENFSKAEADCSLALKINKNYVKAYLRRAEARQRLDNPEGAQFDLTKALELEPQNKEAKKSLEAVQKKLGNKKPAEQRPVSIFTASRNNNKSASKIEVVQSRWGDDDDVIAVKPVNRPPHLRSKKPLKRLEIAEVDGIDSAEPVVARVVEKQIPKTMNDLRVVEKSTDEAKRTKDIKNNANSSRVSEVAELVAPKTAIQFSLCWRCLNTPELKYKYLKMVEASKIPSIFKQSLDSQTLYEILQVLSEDFIKNGDEVFDFLSHLAEVKRFSALTMLLGAEEKSCLWKLIDYVKESESRTKEEVDRLVEKYQL